MPPDTAPPEWQAYTMPNYHAVMTEACAALQHRIEADAAFRLSILTDPRDLHRTLFAEFTPPIIRNMPAHTGARSGRRSRGGARALRNSSRPKKASHSRRPSTSPRSSTSCCQRCGGNWPLRAQPHRMCSF